MNVKTNSSDLDGFSKVKQLANCLEQKQAMNVVALDLCDICPITEYVIVATARGARHAQALADALLQFSGTVHFEYFGLEGYSTATWILMDFNEVIVHIFQEETRSLYNIEGLWSESVVMDMGFAQAE